MICSMRGNTPNNREECAVSGPGAGATRAIAAPSSASENDRPGKRARQAPQRSEKAFGPTLALTRPIPRRSKAL